MKAKWFILCWLSSAVFMYGLSFLWHGVLLNDYVHLQYPMWLYFLLSGLVYFVIGFVLTYLYKYTYTHKLKYKGVVFGALLGFFIYLIAFVLGVSFNQSSPTHIVVDFLWQMIEQGIGGAIVGAIVRVLTDMRKIPSLDQ